MMKATLGRFSLSFCNHNPQYLDNRDYFVIDDAKQGKFWNGSLVLNRDVVTANLEFIRILQECFTNPHVEKFFFSP